MTDEDQPEIRYLGDLERLEIKPGDRFILTVPRPITMAMREHIQQAWREFVGGEPDQFKLLIVEEGMKIGVLGRDIAA